MFKYFAHTKGKGRGGMNGVAEKFDLDLELCMTESEIDDYFLSKGISGVSERMEHISEYMGIIGSECFGELTEDEQYSGLKELFLSGKWKYLNGR